MALCVYHENKESVGVCVICKQDVCAKCLEFGADGMCGMCLEMANARKASMEANRQSRIEAAAQRPAPAGPGGPAGTRPPGPNGPPGPRPNGPPGPRPNGPPGPNGPRPNGPPGPRPNGAPGGPRPANPSGGLRPPGAPGSAPRPAGPRGLVVPPKPQARPGMCADHPDQAASVACTHCKKKVCPYCLDLYDLCGECRTLPQCARHESMVAAERCVGCNMHYCHLCLGGTNRCDRCRTLGITGEGKGQATRAKTGAPAGAPAAGAPSGALGGAPGAAQRAQAGPPPRKAPAAAARYVPPSQRNYKGLYAAVGAIVLLIGLGLAYGASRTITAEEGDRLLQEEMGYVQQAANALYARNGRYPDTEKAILDQITVSGIAVDKLKLPMKLSVNGAPVEPYSIAYQQTVEGFEIRALDHEGRPLIVGGRDVVLRSAPSPSKRRREATPDDGADETTSVPRPALPPNGREIAPDGAPERDPEPLASAAPPGAGESFE